MMETVFRTNYEPGRTLDELEKERLLERLGHTPTESFRIMMKLIRISKKMKQGKIIHYTKSI